MNPEMPSSGEPGRSAKPYVLLSCGMGTRASAHQLDHPEVGCFGLVGSGVLGAGASYSLTGLE